MAIVHHAACSSVLTVFPAARRMGCAMRWKGDMGVMYVRMRLNDVCRRLLVTGSIATDSLRRAWEEAAENE
jgi:hypothetical protein